MTRRAEDLTTLAGRMRRARKLAKLTQGELAERAGTTQQTISDVERGRVDQPRDLVQIAEALGVRPIWLQTGRGAPELEAEARDVGGDGFAAALVDFGNRVRNERNSLGLTPAALARVVGISTELLAEIEAGRVWPLPVVLTRLAGELRTSLDWLVSGWNVDVLPTGRENDPLAKRLHELPPEGYRRTL